MKQTKWLAGLLAGAMIFGLTACGSNTSSSAAAPSSIPTETAAATEHTTVSSVEPADSAVDQAALQNQLNDLTNQENAIFDSHKELWEKVFASMDKNTVNPEADYCDILSSAIDAAEGLSDDDVNTLKADVELIRPIEDQMTQISEQYNPTDAAETQSISVSAFPAFSGKDLDGNDVDNNMFSQNAVTLVNLWFSGCKPCVEELSALNQLNEDLKAKGGAVIGINTDTLDGNEDAIAEAKNILSEKGASYQNIYFAWDSDAGNMLSQIFSFPTTLLVDRNGNIVGDPIVGGITSDEVMKEVTSRIDEILAADQGA